MKLLLDTCTLLWLAAEPDRLSEKAAKAIGDTGHELLFSDASIWEICLKWQSGKLTLPDPPRNWCEDQTSTWKIGSCPIARSHMCRVVELPLHHKDPFDRLLVAQALEERMTIVTPDPHIRNYPVSWLW